MKPGDEVGPRGDVLERNVEALLRRAYVPVLPRPEFRDALQDAWQRELRRGVAGGGAPTSAMTKGAIGRRLFAAAAALLLVLGAAWLWRAVDPERTDGTPTETPLAQVERAPASSPTTAELAERDEHDAAPRADGPTEALRVDAAPTEREATVAATRDAPAVSNPTDSGTTDAVDGLEGRLLAADGEPLRAFRVALRLVGDPTHYAPARTLDVTSDDGRFRWSEVPEGRYEVFAWAQGHAVRSLGLHSLGPDAPRVRLEDRLERGGSLRGHVVDAATGLGLPGVTVIAERDTPQPILPMGAHPSAPLDAFWLPASTRTRADGSFELEHLSAGAHTLRASLAGYAPTWSTALEVPAEGRGAEVLLELGPGGVLEGRVEHEDGTPWSGAPVVATLMGIAERPQNNFALAHTDVAGRYRIEDLPAEPLLAVLPYPDPVAATGRAGGRAGERGPRVKPVQVLPGATARVDFLAASAGPRLLGKLLDGAGAAVRHQNVCLFDASRGAERLGLTDFLATATDARGAFTFEGLAPGPYALYLVEDMGRWIRWLALVDVTNGPEEVHPFELRAGTLRVRVVDGRNGDPVAGAALHLDRQVADGAGGYGAWYAGSGRTDGEGHGALEPLPAGRYRVTAQPTRATGDAPLAFTTSDWVELAEAGAVELEVVLADGVPLTLRLEGEDGAPVREAALSLRAAGAADPVSLDSASGDGRHRLVVPPGAFELEVHTPAGRSEPLRVEARLGEPLERRLVIHPDSPTETSPERR